LSQDRSENATKLFKNQNSMMLQAKARENMEAVKH
jgi:hypothetical protein